MANGEKKKTEGATERPQGTPASGRILSMDMGKHVADCYSGESPPCRMACPLDLDIPEFMAKLRRGKFKSAYNLLRDYVIFPEIVSQICGEPCADACARGDVDAALELSKLERAAAAFADKAAPAKYNTAGKGKTVAVVGAGLCGLSCTIRLASHGYGVVVFERSNSAGGRLHGLLPGGGFMEEIALQTQHTDYELRTGTLVKSLDELREFDAVLLACGPDGCDFGLLDGLDRDSLGSAEAGIFLGGGLIGSSPIESIENGIRASQSIESYLKIGRMHEMTGVSVRKPSRLKINKKLFLPAEQPAAGTHAKEARGSGKDGNPIAGQPAADIYTKEQAMQEAARCPGCDCSDCMRSCDFMKTFGRLPKKIVNDVRVRLNPVEGLQGGKGTIMINSCNACGLCAEVCSEDIDMGDFLLETRSIMHREGSLPPAFHDFWIRDMFHAQSEKAYLESNAPGKEKSEYLFFPGCQLGASAPACVEKAYEYLLEKLPGTGILLGCCGAPAEWAGDDPLVEETVGGIRKAWEAMGKPKVIFACPSCEKMLGKHLPEIEKVSVFETIQKHGLPASQASQGDGSFGAPASAASGETVSIFDPCSSRHSPGMQDSVRSLVSMTGREVRELPAAGREAVCCGYGGHIYPANRELAGKIAQNRIGLGPHPFVTYCVNCRDIFSRGGKECVHILDLAFGTGDVAAPVPSLSKKRENREALKKDLLRQVWGQGAPSVGGVEGIENAKGIGDVKDNEDTAGAEGIMEVEDTAGINSPEMEGKGCETALAPGLEEKLDRLLVLEGDIRETIRHCEETGARLLDPETGCYVAHRRLGVVTLWVEYRTEGGAYIVENAYCHRMRIEGE
ncbi:MAG: heterodisulfide reductase-related iron-sulfur binding cluster [Clostridiales bacterium]|nr:heterodisulfide reductase-related iron-sulfur binding cluster [Clostridiales bacterium]